VSTHVLQTEARHGFVAAQRRALDRYGVDAESRFIPTPVLDGHTHVLVTGEGPPVMMVIGGGMVAALWAPLMARLGDFTLLAVDPPGHGLTGSAPYRTATIRALAKDFLTQVMDGLELGEAPFIAQSMGGLWSSWLAIDRPELVSRICYIACPALMLGSSAPLPLRIGTLPGVMSLLNTLDPPSPSQVVRMARMSGEDLSGLTELRDLFLAFERLPHTADTILELHRALVRLRGPRPEVELTASDLAQIHQPTMMIWGEHDPYGSPDVGRRATGILPDAKLHVVDGGHGPWFTRSDEMAPLIRQFLLAH
jgi:pimeloyl-ACP methyl ester carboxylesterase